jgi:hypothetical protein
MHHMALAASGKKQHLFNRIKRIMEMKKESLNYGRLIAVVLLVTAIGISAVWLTPGFAQMHKEDKTVTRKKSMAWFSEETLTVKDNNGNEKTYSRLEEWPEEEKVKLAREYAQKGTELYFGNSCRQLKLNDDGATTSIIVPKVKPFPAAVPEPPAAPHPVAMAEPNEAPEAAEDAADPEAPEAPVPAVSYETITREVQQAMKQVDWNKINKEIAEATKEAQNIDWDQIQKDVNDGLAQAQAQMNDPEVRKEIRKSIRIARREAARAMEDAREAIEDARVESKRAIEESRREMEDQRRDVEEKKRIVQQNRVVINNARVTAPGNAAVIGTPSVRDDSFDKMLDRMNDEGLIDRNDNFKIEKNDDRLYINGEEQSTDVYNKYKSYLKGEKIKIKGNKNNLSVSITN